MFEVRQYSPDRADEWNAFVAQSKNGTFLFDRRYMDYHRDRFEDCSIMVYRKDRLFALLPGNRKGDTFVSHQGLTYGGFVTDAQATAEHVCEAFVAVNEWLRSEGFRKVIYKPVPWIYQSLPAEEDVYALFVRCHARLIERDVSSTVFLHHRLKFTESRLSGIRKARRFGFEVRESDDVEAFWTILSENLHVKYDATPVHTASEMRLLKDRFPDSIRLFMTYQGDVPMGGTILYLTPQVVHTQYISASSEGKQLGALDLLFDCLLNEMDFHRPYFDFGTSARENSNEVISSLIFQKQGFGGRSVCYDWYEYDL
jgi:hypothetical protein